ncbi:MAG TPA: hypothetical protein V6D50_06620 [Chroococcales cyanobacterium]|jgi:hypothetical protein
MPIPPAIVDFNPAPIQIAPAITGITDLVIYTPSSSQEISNMVLSSPPAEAPTQFTPSAPPNDGATWTTLSTTPTDGATWTSLGATSANEPTWTPYQYPYTQP